MIPAFATKVSDASLVVRLHRDARNCTASFRGSVTETTRTTINGLADLLAGEESVVLDLRRIEVIDRHGADALEALIDSVRALGASVVIIPSSVPVRANERNCNE
jgi:anti-anti-sigma regulatory factor